MTQRGLFSSRRACAVEFFQKPSCKYRDNKSSRIISRFNIAIMAEALVNTTEIKSRPARRAYASSVSVFADYYLASHRRSHRLWWGYEHEDSTKLVDIASGHEILKCRETFKLYLARLCSPKHEILNCRKTFKLYLARLCSPKHEILKCRKTFKLYLARLCSPNSMVRRGWTQNHLDGASQEAFVGELITAIQCLLCDTCTPQVEFYKEEHERNHLTEFTCRRN